MKINVVSQNSEIVNHIELNNNIYGAAIRADILSRVVTWQLAGRRSGNHKAKVRSEVRGSTKKIVRQKGSGGARHGSKRGAQFRGGGIIFGPVVRSHAYSLPKKVRRLGMRMALSEKLQDGNLIVIDNLNMQNIKTTNAKQFMEKLGTQSVLFIDNQAVNHNLQKSIDNIVGFDALPQIGANVYDILRKQKIVITVDAAKALEDRLK